MWQLLLTSGPLAFGKLWADTYCTDLQLEGYFTLQPGSQPDAACQEQNTVNNDQHTVKKQAPVVGSWNCMMQLP